MKSHSLVDLVPKVSLGPQVSLVPKFPSEKEYQIHWVLDSEWRRSEVVGIMFRVQLLDELF